ncbi:MAG: hypothetical protein OXG90_05610 [Gammaproteobacteria bacterium]|nr:hypothetical protein [Gammaproteobacteria bacterium]
MATPEEINDRLLVGYVPTYILVMVHVAYLTTGRVLLILVFGSALAGVALFSADRITKFRSKHRHPDTLKISESVVSGNIVIFWAIVYSGMIYAHFSNGYEGIAVVSPIIAGMFAIREVLEKFRFRKLRLKQP